MAINSFQPRIMMRTITQAGIELDPETRERLASRNMISASRLINCFNSFLPSLDRIITSFSKS